MSTDQAVTKDLIEVLENGKEGFSKGAEKLAESDRPDLAAKFREYSTQRARCADELHTMALQYGDQIKEKGSAAGALHRGWMSLKDALSGSDPDGVLDAAEQGEDHAVDAYEKALKEDISPELRTVVQRQFGEVRAAHDDVRSLRNAHR